MIDKTLRLDLANLILMFFNNKNHHFKTENCINFDDNVLTINQQ